MWSVVLLNKLLQSFDDVKKFYKSYYGIDVDYNTRIKFRIVLSGCRRRFGEVYLVNRGNWYEVSGVPFRIVRTEGDQIVVETVRSDPYYALMDALYLEASLKERFEAKGSAILKPEVIE